MADKSTPVGWLEFFFEGYLPDSPCPPGCIHRHASWINQAGSLNSEPNSPSCSYVGDMSEEDSPTCRGTFPPIPMLLKKRRTSDPFSERSMSSSHSPVGYPEDVGLCGGCSEEDLRHIDSLISHYNEQLSESEFELRSVAEDAAPRLSAVDQDVMFSDVEIENYQSNRKPRPSLVAECTLAKCHILFPGELSMNDFTYRYPFVNNDPRKHIKVTCDATTQSDIESEYSDSSKTGVSSIEYTSPKSSIPVKDPFDNFETMKSDKSRENLMDITTHCTSPTTPNQHETFTAPSGPLIPPGTTEQSLTSSQSGATGATLRPLSNVDQTKDKAKVRPSAVQFDAKVSNLLTDEQRDLYNKVRYCLKISFRIKTIKFSIFIESLNRALFVRLLRKWKMLPLLFIYRTD